MTIEQKNKFKEEFVDQHKKLVGFTQGVEVSENWKENYPLSNREYDALVEWGVENIISQFKINQRDAEKEISWLVMEIGLECNV